MPRQGLRIVGSVFLGCTLLAGFAWKDAASQFTSVEKRLTIQTENPASVSFTPKLEEAIYNVNLKFDGVQQPLLDCSAIQASGIEWSIVRDGKVVESGSLTNLKQTKGLSCNQEESIVTLGFSTSELVLNQQHFLNLWLTDQKNRNIKLNSTVTVFPFGIAVHYALIDLGLQELLIWGLLMLGFGCFLPDIYSFLFRKKLVKPGM